MALPSSAPPSRPAVSAAAHDLNDAEIAELDALLAGIPEPLQPFDAFMLDGFLAGLVVHPQSIEPERWLPYVFDAGGHRWGAAEPEAPQRRARELVLRRHAAIHRALAEYGHFEPLIAAAGDSPGSPDTPPPADPVADDTQLPADPVAEALGPWLAGFDATLALFPGLEAVADERVAAALERLQRFLPADPDAPSPAPASAAAAAAGPRPTSIDAAIDELIGDVAELYDATEPIRYQVEQVRRDAPKVGRNDRCPCGSGRKFKHCHGAG
ncbi:MAG: UPF0149 family protein [Caldimonas sp.]